MADTTLPAVTQEVTPPTLLMADGQPTATSLQVAEHFGKRHTHVLRAIRNLAAELPDEHKPIFGLMSQSVEVGQGGLRSEPIYQMNRDGFALLAMGFTGPEATIPDELTLKRDLRSNIQAAETDYKTNVEKVFTCGDMRRGQSLVVWALQEGKLAAGEVDRFLSGDTAIY